MKKLNKKESASMSELLGILSYSERDTCFQLEGGGCLDIVRVICSDCLLYTSPSPRDVK